MELTTGEPSERKETPQILVAKAKPALTKPIHALNIVIDLGNLLHDKPDSSKKQEISKTLSAAMEPTLNKSVFISTEENGTLQTDLTPLSDILQKFCNNTNLLENWIIQTLNSTNKINQHPVTTNLNSTQNKQRFFADSDESFLTSKTRPSDLLQSSHKNSIEEQTPLITAAVRHQQLKFDNIVPTVAHNAEGHLQRSQEKFKILQKDYHNTAQQLSRSRGVQYPKDAITVAGVDRLNQRKPSAEVLSNLQQVTEGAAGHIAEDTQQIVDRRKETRLL